MEPNPKFGPELEMWRSEKVYPMWHQAAYMCDKPKQKFYLDRVDAVSSTLNATHQDMADTWFLPDNSVTVELYNVIRLLQETAKPDDEVVVRMDVEGTEYDILPCLADAPAAKLIDKLYVEDHCPGSHWCPTIGQAGNSRSTFTAAVEKLTKKGVEVVMGRTSWNARKKARARASEVAGAPAAAQ